MNLRFLSDRSLLVLIASNILTIFLAVTEGWSLATIMWVYWFQSVTIGFFNVFRILRAKKKSTTWDRWYSAFFFAIHFGLFHLVYLVFLSTGSKSLVFGQGIGSIDFASVFVPAAVFFVNHLYSYRYNREHDVIKQNSSALMLYPYARIIPLHFTIMFGALFGAALPFFLALKTVADALMHSFEHGVIRKDKKV